MRSIHLRLKLHGHLTDNHVVYIRIKSKNEITERKWAVAGQKETDWHIIDGDRFIFNGFGTVLVCVTDSKGNTEKQFLTIRKKANKLWKLPIPAAICIILSVFTVLAIGSGYVIYENYIRTPVLAHAPESKPSGTGSAIDGAYAGKTSSEILAELQKQQIEVDDNIMPSATFNSGSKGTSGSCMVENKSSNNVLMQAEFTIDGKTVATSAFIKPGQHIESIALDADVKPGTYKAIAYISYYSPDNHNYLGKSGYPIALKVQ